MLSFEHLEFEISLPIAPPFNQVSINQSLERASVQQSITVCSASVLQELPAGEDTVDTGIQAGPVSATPLPRSEPTEK